MNKITIITILLALVAMAGQAQVKCHIRGELRDTTHGKTVVICPADVDIRVSDNYITTMADAKGQFSCDVNTDKMQLYNVFLYEQYEHGSWRNENFLVENNATVSLCFEDNTWKVVSGGSEQALKVKMDSEAERLYVSKLNEIEKQAEKEIRPRVEELQKQGKNPEEDTLLMKRNQEFMAEYEKLYNEYRAWEFDYYAAHPMQYALYDIAERMQYRNDRYDDMKARLMNVYHTAYENFHPENPIHNTVLTLEAAWHLTPGKPYIDFEALTPSGERVNVSTLYRGKVSVIDFWASWCGPCRAEIPNLIKAYEQYKDKGFMVLGVAVNDKPEDTLKAIEKDGITYPQILNSEGIAASTYGFNAIPYIGLFGPDCTILSCELRGDAIKAKLAEIFDK